MSSLERALPERIYAQVMATDPQRVDRSLPEWARRSYPIVRQELGVFHRVMTPDLWMPVRFYAAQSLVILMTFPLPELFNLLLPIVTVPIVLIPVALYFYLEALGRVGAYAAASVAEARRKQQFTLLRATPMPLIHILAAKASAAIWRYIETLDLVLLSAALLSLPVLILQYAGYYAPSDFPIISRLFMIVGFAACLIRLLIEPVMIAGLGILMGALTGARIPAILATLALGFAYAVLINLPRLMPLTPAERFVIEMVLPLALPPLITLGALRLATYVLGHD
ncbi:MAG: hypothetical protein KC547_08355 [Anaerolineae bacterium]|nr:hypothetical protein [Anaerolineae bacterium]